MARVIPHFFELLSFFEILKFWARAQKWNTFTSSCKKASKLLRCWYCVSLDASTCVQNITLITAHTTLTPTRKLNGKTCVHTVFYLDSFGQEMPSLFLVKDRYFHSSFHFGYSLSYFRHASLVYRLVPRARKFKCGWVVIIRNSSLAIIIPITFIYISAVKNFYFPVRRRKYPCF